MKPTIKQAVSTLAVLAAMATARAETLYFQASTSPIDFNWFSGGNWYVPDSMGKLIHAARLPLVTDSVEILTRVDVPGTVHVASLMVHALAIVNLGDVTVDNLTMKGGSPNRAELGTTTMHITTQMTVIGDFNDLSGTTLIIEPGAAARIEVDPANPAQRGALVLQNGTLVSNQGAFILTDQTDVAGEGGSGTTNIFRNAVGATFSSSSTNVNTVAIISGNLMIDNNGTFRVDSGELTCGPGIAWSSSLGRATFQTTTTGATLGVSGFAIGTNEMTTVKGPGTTHLASNALLNGLLNVGALDPITHLLDPGTLLIDSAVAGGGTLHVQGTPQTGSLLTLNSEAFSGKADFLSTFTGSINIDAGAFLNISGTGQTSIEGGTLNNSGTATWNATGDLDLGGTAVLNNLPGALFDMTNDQFILISSVGANPPPINNAGTFRKSTGIGSQIEASFNNSGLFEVLSGTIYFVNNFIQSAGATDLNGGNISDAGGMDLNGGSLSGSGSFQGPIRNNGGTISPGHSPGKLTIGGSYTQGSNGVLQIEVGGLTTPGADFDQVAVTGAATLDGTLRISLINGYLPKASDSVLVLAAGFMSGTFSKVIGQNSGNGLYLRPLYQASGVALVAKTGAPGLDPTGLSLANGQFHFGLTGAASKTYITQASTDLVTWMPLSTNMFLGSSLAVVDPGAKNSAHRFYRTVLVNP